MPKNIDDMVVPDRRKSIRNIPIPSGRGRGEKVSRRKSSEEVRDDKETSTPLPPPRRLEMPTRIKSSRRRIWALIGGGALVVIFAVLSIFNGATLTYTPRSANMVFNDDEFTAKKSANSGLLYSIVKLSEEKSVTVPASGEKEVERKASGTIVVYNNASTQTQRLIENTRFEAPSGKIYRIRDAISVPGKVGSTPGSLEVTVYADEPGEEFNIGLVDWTIPGFKGTSNYDNVYARSKTPMTSGFVGVEKAVAESDLTKAKNELRAQLNDELISKAKAEVPKDFVLFTELSSIIFDDIVQTDSPSADSATLTLNGNLYGVMFKRVELAREISKGKTTIAEGDRVDFNSPETLQVSFVDEAPSDILSTEEIEFNVSGNVELLWLTDESALKSDLAGQSKKNLPAVLVNYPTIVSATATVRPFWKSTFPEKSSKIRVRNSILTQ